jgi:hypothetical protein
MELRIRCRKARAANVVQIRRTAMVVIVMGVTGAVDVSMLQKLS